MNLILIIILLITSVCVVIFVKPKNHNYSNEFTSEYSGKNIDQIIIGEHNKCITRYNGYITEFQGIVNSLRNQITLFNDYASYEKLKFLIQEFDAQLDEINDLLSRSNICINNQDPDGAMYCQTRMKQEFKNLEEYIKTAKTITPTENEFNDYFTAEEESEVQTKESKTETGFFSGCKSKEDIVARYKHLCAAFHPDSKGGDEKMFNLMKTEYNELMKRIL